MEAASRVNESGFRRMPGQGTAGSSPTSTNSSVDYEVDAAYESSPDESPFRCGFDTPQSSVVDIVLRPGAPRPRRVVRFVECFCVSGGPCVGTGGQATCNCGASPEVGEAPRGAEKRSIKKFAKGIARGLRQAWRRSIQRVKDRATRAMRKGLHGRGGGEW